MSASQSIPMGANGWEPDFTVKPKFEVREEVCREIIAGYKPGSHFKMHEPWFPTICVCLVCGGVTGSTGLKYNQGKPGIELTKEEAFIVACVQHGTYVEKWKDMNCGNSFDFPHLCQCECKHEFQETMRPPTPRSGLHRSKCRKCGIEMEYDTSD